MCFLGVELTKLMAESLGRRVGAGGGRGINGGRVSDGSASDGASDGRVQSGTKLLSIMFKFPATDTIRAVQGERHDRNGRRLTGKPAYVYDYYIA